MVGKDKMLCTASGRDRAMAWPCRIPVLGFDGSMRGCERFWAQGFRVLSFGCFGVFTGFGLTSSAQGIRFGVKSAGLTVESFGLK